MEELRRRAAQNSRIPLRGEGRELDEVRHFVGFWGVTPEMTLSILLKSSPG